MSSTKFLFLFAMLGGMASGPVLAYDADLFAGQNMLVGNVNVAVDINGDVLVTYTIDDTDNDGDGVPEDAYWCLQYVHADLQVDPAAFPQTKKGNPIPGQFAVYEPVDCESAVTVNLGPQPDEAYYVAAHAEIDNTPACQLEGVLFGTEQDSGWIWAIDAVNCLASPLIDTGDPAPADGNLNSPNGLAYDALNDVLYFSVSGAVNSASPEQPGSDLWFADLGVMSVGQVNLGGIYDSLFGHSAGGTFFMGKYWYVANRSDDLYEVDVSGVPPTEAWYCDIDGDGDGQFRFGDSAVIPGTTTLIASTNGPEQNVFTVDVSDCSGYTALCTDPGPGNAFGGLGECADQQQLSFGSNGILYGHSTGGGEFFEVSTVTGLNDSLACDEFDTPEGISVLYFTDLASGPQCKADRDETAWGAGNAFSGKNWATYLGPIEPMLYIAAGYSGLTEEGSVRYKGLNTGGEIYLGTSDLGIGGNRVEAGCSDWADGTYDVAFSFDGSELEASVDNSDCGPLPLDWAITPTCGSWDTMDILVSDRLTTGGTAFNNVMLGAFALGDFGSLDVPGEPGVQNWTIAAFDFSQPWVMTGELEVSGWTGNERMKLQLTVGCLP